MPDGRHPSTNLRARIGHFRRIDRGGVVGGLPLSQDVAAWRCLDCQVEGRVMRATLSFR